MINNIAIFIATGMYSGYLRPFSGTWGTIPAWLIGYFLIDGNQLFLILAAVITILVSIWAAGKAESKFGHDSKNIVIDEWAGMLVTFILLPFSLINYIIAFIAFRAFDVVKLPPAAQFEKLPGGWGVTMDDVAAGVYANIFTRLIIWSFDKFNLDMF